MDNINITGFLTEEKRLNAMIENFNKDPYAVSVKPQVLRNEEKKQARLNIGIEEISPGRFLIGGPNGISDSGLDISELEQALSSIQRIDIMSEMWTENKSWSDNPSASCFVCGAFSSSSQYDPTHFASDFYNRYKAKCINVDDIVYYTKDYTAEYTRYGLSIDPINKTFTFRTKNRGHSGATETCTQHFLVIRADKGGRYRLKFRVSSSLRSEIYVTRSTYSNKVFSSTNSNYCDVTLDLKVGEEFYICHFDLDGGWNESNITLNDVSLTTFSQSANNIVIDSAITTLFKVGGVEAGNTFPKGTSIGYILERILTGTLN